MLAGTGHSVTVTSIQTMPGTMPGGRIRVTIGTVGMAGRHTATATHTTQLRGMTVGSGTGTHNDDRHAAGGTA